MSAEDDKVIDDLMQSINALRTEHKIAMTALDKIHKHAATCWGSQAGDGWLKIMQLADPGNFVSSTQQ